MFPRKTILLVLLAIVILSLVVRYPLVEHERYQTDSYFIHTLSSSIVRDGQAAWTFSPLSYVGYYPFSYPSGVPFVLAEVSILTGLDMNVCILLADVILSTLFCLVVFCLAREFIHRAEFVLLATLFAALAPRFVDTTYWDGSARGMEVVLIALMMFTTFRAGFLRSNMMLMITVLIGGACFAVHHMAILLILYGAGYVLTVLTIRYLPMVFRSRSRKWATVSALSIGLGAMIVSLNYFGVLGNSVEKVGESGFFAIKSPLVAIVVNLVTSYIHQIGIVLVLAAFCIFDLLRFPRFNVRNVFPLVVLIAFVPVIGSSLYVSMLLAPFVAVLGAMWVQRLRDSKRLRTKAFAASLAIFVALSLTTTVWSLDRWNQSVQPTRDIVVVNDGVFNDATYLNSYGREVGAISNSESLQGQLTAYSDTRFLGSGIQAAINKDVTGKEIQADMFPSTTPFPGNLYNWYIYKNESLITRFALSLMVNGPSSVNMNSEFSGYAASHTNLLIVIDNNWPSDYASIYGPYPSHFLKEVRNSQLSASEHGNLTSYCTYGSQRVMMYIIQIPLD